jgi:putative lipoic acid-binding regulatory protein
MSSGDDTKIQFPCVFPIKAVGKADEDFALLVADIVRRYAPELDEAAIKLRRSRSGKWMAVTVTVEAVSKEQLDAIYRDLSGHERVVWAL